MSLLDSQHLPFTIITIMLILYYLIFFSAQISCAACYKERIMITASSINPTTSSEHPKDEDIEDQEKDE